MKRILLLLILGLSLITGCIDTGPNLHDVDDVDINVPVYVDDVDIDLPVIILKKDK